MKIIYKRSLFVLFCLSAQASADVFIRNGDVYDGDSRLGQANPITSTNGRVEKFVQSPSKRFLVYFQFASFVDSNGEFGEHFSWPQDQLFHLGIYDLKKKKLIQLIIPPQGYFYQFKKWTSDDQLLIYQSTGLALKDCVVFDAINNSLKRVSRKDFDLLLAETVQPDAPPDANRGHQ